MRVTRRALMWAILGGVGSLTAACSGGAPPPPTPARPVSGLAAVATRATALQQRPTLTLASGRPPALVEPLLSEFRQRQPVRLEVQYGDSAALATGLVQAGAGAGADLFFAQEAGPLGLVAAAGRLVELPRQQLRRVAERFRSPRGEWLGLSGQARVIVYGPRQVAEPTLPDTVDGLLDRRWAGMLGWAPTGSSFQAFITAMRLLQGEAHARHWLLTAQANGARTYPTEAAIVEAVARGEVLVGLADHDHLYALQATREGPLAAAVYSPRGGGAGALMNVAGIGVLKSSARRELALQLIEYLQAPPAQYHFIGRHFECGLAGGAEGYRLPFSGGEINVPRLELDRLADVATTRALLRSTGVVA